MPTLKTLHPRFRPFAEQLLEVARSVDPRFTVTSARRSRTDQMRLYNDWLKGRSPFPALPPGRSQHERGWAVDIVRLGIDPSSDELLAELGAAWRAAGGVWGGSVDPVHFEAPKRWTGRR
ncbi:MAG TPA: D-alanyl-D-alanine carboxypeptidase family protein [Anaeromyxobacter sp.]|nr:D-alanyl-D-alanine carboxypeptidase family protein [Anaeromyxobacter sp.]